MTVSRWYVGDLWKPKAAVKDPDTGALADPDVVTFNFIAPDGTDNPIVATRISLGIYRATHELTAPGEWTVVVTAQGTYQRVEEATITVRRPKS